MPATNKPFLTALFFLSYLPRPGIVSLTTQIKHMDSNPYLGVYPWKKSTCRVHTLINSLKNYKRKKKTYLMPDQELESYECSQLHKFCLQIFTQHLAYITTHYYIFLNKWKVTRLPSTNYTIQRLAKHCLKMSERESRKFLNYHFCIFKNIIPKFRFSCFWQH